MSMPMPKESAAPAVDATTRPYKGPIPSKVAPRRMSIAMQLSRP